MNNKGLVSGLFVLVIALVVIAFLGVISLKIWGVFNDSIQNLPEETANNMTKQKVDNLTNYLLYDKIFILFFVVLSLGFLITSATLPAEKPFFFLLYGGALLGIVIVSALFSNVWAYIISNPNLISSAAQMSGANFILQYYPVVLLLVGALGGLIFYSRRSGGEVSESVGGDGF